MSLILVTGSRSWTDRERVMDAFVGAQVAALSSGPPRRMTVMHGACPSGADLLAADVAEQWGWLVLPRAADWDAHGRLAGLERNLAMVREAAGHLAQGVVCLAFTCPCTTPGCRTPRPHWTHGAVHCGTVAEQAGIPTTWIRSTS